MSSLEIAELTNKEHKHVLRDIDNMLIWLDIHSAQIWTEFIDGSGKRNRMALLDKELTLVLISWYNVKLRQAIIRRWQQLEVQGSAPMSLEEMTLMVVQWQQNRIKELEVTVIHKQKQMMWAKGGHTKEKNRLKKVIDETEQKAKFYENLAEERKRLFWWS